MVHSLIVRQGVWQSLRRASTQHAWASSTVATIAPSNLGELCQSLLNALEKSTGQRNVALILRVPGDRVFRVHATRGYSGKDLSSFNFARESALIRHFSAHVVPARFGQLQKLPWFKVLPGREREALDSLEGSLFVPLSTRAGFVGLLVLGEKGCRRIHWTGNGLSATDCNNLAGIIEEALLRQQLRESDQISKPVPGRPEQEERLLHLEHTARSIAHDLNNILTTIISHAQLLEVEEENMDVNPRTAAILQAALDGAESVRKMRVIKSQPADTQFLKVEVNDLIKSTLQMIDPHWRQGRISFPALAGGRGSQMDVMKLRDLSVVSVGPPRNLAVNLNPSGYVFGNASELRMVLTNIISNAVDALSPEYGHIEITSGHDDRWAIVKVKDYGEGISPNIIGRVFEPYFTTKENHGSGMGLFISHSIVARHGGKLEVNSQEGKGSIFTIILPLAQREGSEKL